MTNAIPARTSVLISGCGPVGAALANLLGRMGIDVLVIDKSQTIFPLPRAIGLDNEALRILQAADIREGDFETIATPCVTWHSSVAGQFIRANTAGVIDGHPKLVLFYQPELDQLLRDRAASYPSVHLGFGLELTEVAEDGDGITATLRAEDGSQQRVRADYLVGADGAGSLVRQVIGIGFEGRSYEQSWLIIDVKNRPPSITHAGFSCEPGRPYVHMPAPGNRARWEFRLAPGETAEDVLRDDKIHELLAPWGTPDELDIERKAVYRFHARVAKSFQRGRIMVVGDAAHITPPFAGQGLVAGLRDVYNLAWKLAWVLEGRASPSILGSYTTERQPHARAMVDLARFLGMLIMPENYPVALLKHLPFRLARKIGRVRRFFDELEVKPRNAFRNGLFVSGTSAAKVCRGTQLPQCRVADGSGRQMLSDDALGLNLTLVGFGRDPNEFLDTWHRAYWDNAGGRTLEVCHRSQRLQTSGDGRQIEDLEGLLLPGFAPVGWCAVVRPDRSVLHDGPIEDAPQIIRESLRLLGAPQTVARPAALSLASVV